MLNINQLDEAKHLAYRHRRLTEMLMALDGRAGVKAEVRLKVDRPGVGMGHTTIELHFANEDLRPLLDESRCKVECQLHALGVSV